MPYKFEVFKDNKGILGSASRHKYGKIMFASEGYKNKPSAMKTIESIKKNAANADVDEQV